MYYPDSYIPQRLVKFFRDGLVEQEHLGFVVSTDFEFGETFGYPFYLRSCAKTIQASLIVDYDLDFTSEEIAICCASHAGEKCHVELAKHLLNKIGVDESKLRCGIHKPVSKTAQEELIRNGEEPTVFHNNCVGKHIMMLALCKKNGWDIDTYDQLEHPLQQEIKTRIYDFCEVEEDYPITKDGCGVPICAMPLKNMLKGYLNLFTSEKYKKICDAFRQNPYIIGGEDRLDTKIMQGSDNLVAKVGAGGLCITVNLEKADGILVKILDCDMKAREVTMLSMLKKISWANIPFDKEVKTLHGDVLGEIKLIAM